MGLGVSVFLITLGAILRFAVSSSLIGKSVDIHVIGIILMIVGGATLILQIALSSRTTPDPFGRNRVNGNGGDQPPTL